ncbi:MHS family MFS transporter [Microbispora hainanensis]|uniref:MHS family MFS transporter n=2 Tax=Microbispora hainanensis TaxID=568844 RepID=A0A544YQ75_9ACTN|nr:MHS family MFS transporter [Microbispora hainanensis]
MESNMTVTPQDRSDSLWHGPMRRVLMSSFSGSVIEFYDFVLYVIAAAVVFPHVFFDNLSPTMATIASFVTLAVGYVGRPLGGVIFGHFGDRLGRKGVLVTTMLLMGISTTAIGLLPATATVGVLAPILLVLCRVLQGVAVGGEWGGAMLIALENSPGAKRGFAASFASLGAPAGAMLATGSISLASSLPQDQFLSWGWRIPFLFSVLLVVVGMTIRLKVSESPLFKSLDLEAEKRKVPILEVLRRYPSQAALGIIVAISQLTIDGIATSWAVNHSVELGADRTTILNLKIFGSIALLVAAIISARLSDRWGRRLPLTIGIVAALIFVFPMLTLIQTGTAGGFAVAVIVGQFIQGFILGPLAAFLAELFPTRLRFTGASLCFQTASALGSGFTPLIATSLVAVGGGIAVLGWVWMGVLAVCLVATLIASEGRKRDLSAI